MSKTYETAPRHRRHAERGSGLVLAVLVLALLTAAGIALLFLSQTELRMTRANKDSKSAFQFAESGLEDGRTTLFLTNGEGPFSDDLATAAGANNVIDFDPSAITVSYDSDGKVTAIGGYGDDVPVRALTVLGSSSFVRGSYAAFLTNDPIDGKLNPVDTNNRVMITGIGMGAHRSQEIVEGILEPLRPVFDPPPAALTLLGPQPSFDNGTSNVQNHVGDDCGGNPPGIPGLYAPIVGAVSGSDADEVKGDMNRPDYFTSGPFTGDDTVGDLTDPSDPIVAASGLGTIDPEWTDCPSLEAMVQSLIRNADYYCNTDVSSCAIPTQGSNGDVVVIDGDAAVPGNTTYVGTLLVTGILTFRGNSEWNGVLLAIGEGAMERSGGGNGIPSGAVVVANIDPTPHGPRVDKTDWCSTSPDGFGQAQYYTAGGGDSEVYYCSYDLALANAVKSYKVVEFQQR